MLYLANAHLRVEILDPANPADAAHLGARFCHGGFIWQIHDLALTATPAERNGGFPPSPPATSHPLLSGPEYPAPSPTPFNAQGLPESFRHRTRDGAPLTWNVAGTHGIAIGAGALTADATGHVTLAEPCQWTITPAPAPSVSTPTTQLVFHTRHCAAGFSYALTRTLRLVDRTITSSSELTHLGDTPFDLQWFAHPFWPLTQNRARLALPVGTTLPTNPGFTLAADGTLSFQRPFIIPDDSQFSLLTLPPSAELSLSLDHPALSRVTFTTSFVPSECPVWANAHTVSVEPYLALKLSPGETRHWHVRHEFNQ